MINLPETATAEEISILCNLTARRIQQLAKEDKVPKGVRGVYPLEATIKALFKVYQEDGEDIKKEKFLKLKAERELKQDELSANRGLLMPVDEVRQQIGKIAGFMFEERLRWNRELPPSLAGLSAVEIARIMEIQNKTGWKILKEKFDAVA